MSLIIEPINLTHSLTSLPLSQTSAHIPRLLFSTCAMDAGSSAVLVLVLMESLYCLYHKSLQVWTHFTELMFFMTLKQCDVKVYA